MIISVINKSFQSHHFFHIASFCYLVIVKGPVYSTRFAIVIQIEGEELVPFVRLSDSARQTCVKLIWQGGRFTSFLFKGGLQCNQVVSTAGSRQQPLSEIVSLFLSFFVPSTSEFCSGRLRRASPNLRRLQHIDISDLRDRESQLQFLQSCTLVRKFDSHRDRSRLSLIRTIIMNVKRRPA